MFPSPTHPLPTDSTARGEGQHGADRGSECEPLRRPVLVVGASIVAAVLLTIIFWWPLWTGGGLVGSDIYAYFLPQKAFFAEQLKASQLPVWNNRIGWGYPQLAESQTGVFYPLHLPLFIALDLNSAYSASQLLHYI